MWKVRLLEAVSLVVLAVGLFLVSPWWLLVLVGLFGLRLADGLEE